MQVEIGREGPTTFILHSNPMENGSFKAAWQPVVWKVLHASKVLANQLRYLQHKVGIGAFLYLVATWGISYHKVKFVFAQGKDASPELVLMTPMTFVMIAKLHPAPF